MNAAAVFGPRGMLGRAVIAELRDRGVKAIGISDDIGDRMALETTAKRLASRRVDVAFNCAGVIPLKGRSDRQMIMTNATGPMNLVETLRPHGIRIVHVSTDCVFSGDAIGRIHVTERPDPADLYGKTKYLGEAVADRAAVVRTSFIGPEHGLMRWLLDLPKGAVVEGWLGASWTGSSVWAVARGLIDIAESGEMGLMHLATERVYTKSEVVEALISSLGLWSLTLVRVFTPRINRALVPTHTLPPLDCVLEELCSRST